MTNMTSFKKEEPIRPNSELYFRDANGALVLDESANYDVNRYIVNIGFDHQASFFENYEDTIRCILSNFDGCKTVNIIQNFDYLTNVQQKYQQHLQRKAGATQLLDDESLWLVDGSNTKWRKENSTRVGSVFLFYRGQIEDQDIYKMVQYDQSLARKFAPSTKTFNVVETSHVGLLYEEIHDSGLSSLVFVCAGSFHIDC